MVQEKTERLSTLIFLVRRSRSTFISSPLQAAPDAFMLDHVKPDFRLVDLLNLGFPPEFHFYWQD